MFWIMKILINGLILAGFEKEKKKLFTIYIIMNEN